ncbi:HPF/RaiA family ribosome-associated protein [Lentzea sp. BCCO 10_0798]|jgi:ribosome-associated translation inhibitor RaiA|uniref:HPF/RaiA family ribosome-associated protein n=1 Tax=Lentzea kristufekii TaxID=3095430 RepID=A0ABU4TV17_9PSEU|nr:HPF/RaiA family ribosome-associated protein [Lentzea sp. BCCO 10_0798]MDX8052163.1 HPF/RaiA family ribosome-associated protein [Lentzea sp. BCCO 10_0798]
MKHAGATEIGNVVVELDDRIAVAAKQYAHDKIAPLARYAPEPAEFAHVRLIQAGPRAIAAHVNLDVNGTQVVAKAEAPTFTEAVDAVHDQLRSLLVKMHN